jgi:cell division protein FtsL
MDHAMDQSITKAEKVAGFIIAAIVLAIVVAHFLR